MLRLCSRSLPWPAAAAAPVPQRRALAAAEAVLKSPDFSAVAGRRACASSGARAVAARGVFNFQTRGVPFPSNPFEGDGFERGLAAGAVSSECVDVLDGRQDPELVDGCGAAVSRRGFCLLQHRSAVDSFEDARAVQDTYYPELVELVRRVTRADAVQVVSHVVRQVGESPDGRRGTMQSGTHRAGSFFVHGDFNDSLKGRLEDMLRAGLPSAAGDGGLCLTAEELAAGRLMTLNVWRPLSRTPIWRAPLAICDPTSMLVQDLSTYIHDPEVPPSPYSLPLPIQLTVGHNGPQNRWYMFPGMTRNECLVFKTYDSAGPQPTNGVGVHSSFEDDRDLTGVRLSIEARVLCFFRGDGSAQGKEVKDSASEEVGAKWQHGSAESQRQRPPMENIERIGFYKWLRDAEGWRGPVGFTAKFTIARDRDSIFLDIMRENIAGTRQEAGMLQCDLVSNYDQDAPSEDGSAIFWLLKRFESRSALLRHVESAHYKHCQDRFLSDMGGHPLVQIGLYRIDPLEP